MPVFVKLPRVHYIVTFYDGKIFSPYLGQPLPVDQHNVDVLYRFSSKSYFKKKGICKFNDAAIERAFVPGATGEQQTQLKKGKKGKKSKKKRKLNTQK